MQKRTEVWSCSTRLRTRLAPVKFAELERERVYIQMHPIVPHKNWTRVFIMTLNMLLVFARTRFKLVQTYSLRLVANTHWWKSNRGYVLPCDMYTVIQGIWEMKVLIMLLQLVPLVWCQIMTYLHVGHVILLMPLHALLPAATLVMSWWDCVTLELRRSLLPNTNTGVSALLLIGFPLVRTHTLHCICLFLRPFFRAACCRVLPSFMCVMASSDSCVSTVSSSGDVFALHM